MKQDAIAAGAKEETDAEVQALLERCLAKMKTQATDEGRFWSEAPPFLPEYLVMRAVTSDGAVKIDQAKTFYSRYASTAELYSHIYAIHLRTFAAKVSNTLKNQKKPV